MKKRIFSILLLFCSLTGSLYAQTKADSIAIVTAQWETTVGQYGIVHKRAVIPSLYKGPQHINLVEIPKGKNCIMI